MIIGVSGRNGSGKGTLLEALARNGFEILSLSDVLRQELAEQGVSETRERMIELGTRLRRERGPGALAEVLGPRLNKNTHYGIDSIRHPAEVAVLAATDPGFRLIWVEAPVELRFERMQRRGRPGDPETLQDLERLEDLERGGGDQATQQLDAVCDRSDFRIQNEGRVDELSEALAPILDTMGIPPRS